MRCIVAAVDRKELNSSKKYRKKSLENAEDRGGR